MAQGLWAAEPRSRDPFKVTHSRWRLHATVFPLRAEVLSWGSGAGVYPTLISFPSFPRMRGVMGGVGESAQLRPLLSRGTCLTAERCPWPAVSLEEAWPFRVSLALAASKPTWPHSQDTGI